MPTLRSRTAVLAAGIALAAGTLAPTLAAAPAAASVQAPGSFTGYGFDTCTAPSQQAMDAWWRSSRYAAVGIYISGGSRGCAQPNLTRSWVTTQAARGWRLLPIHVGRQAPCYSGSKARMSSDPATAHDQGIAAAKASVKAARGLGIPGGRVLYLDIEWYPRSNASCDAAVQRFVDGWTTKLHRLSYRSGLYSSGSAAIATMNALKNAGRTAYDYPDHLWIGWYNGRANTDGGPYLDDDVWANGRRVHQYTGNVTERNGGVAIHIDHNFLDVGKGSHPTRARRQCGTEDVTKYRTLRPGKRGRFLAPIAKCLLRKTGYGTKSRSARYGRTVQRAVVRYRRDHGFSAKPVLGRRVWVSLLSQGTDTVLKYGSTGKKVYRLQRSLTAALGRSVPRTGLYGSITTRAVKDYRARVGLPRWPTADARLWNALQAGRR
ncbi:uncharacterized protein DUF1906 [Mumia flava]|uniref:Uncharacterized protein DUF1906 n=1 Tax=Mumia flava TaxID=1348852 RepID=A0A2M9BH24_9ACTN|nr:glycoside hydrolase domain-containing protein [Mumia flava]PJJ57248.1 uncharacterized protein DUF1906 [Mumia flava]